MCLIELTKSYEQMTNCANAKCTPMTVTLHSVEMRILFEFSLRHGSSSHLKIASYGDTLENWVFYFQEFVLLSRMNDNGLGKQNRIHKTNREKK